MDIAPALNYIAYLLPAIVVGVVAWYFFKGHTANEEGRRRYLLHKSVQKNLLPGRLQAYERMTILMDRITPSNLLVRVKPNSSDVDTYQKKLIQNIEDEFSHNIAQQIYITDDCWSVINAAKSATIQIVRKVAMNESVDDADKLRQLIISHFMDKETPSHNALLYIKKEVSEMWR